MKINNVISIRIKEYEMKRNLIYLPIFVLLLLQVVSAQGKKLSVESLYSSEIQAMLRLPQTAWYDEENLLIYDYENQIVKLYNINTGKKIDLFDEKKALLSLADIVGEDEVPDAVGWTDKFNSNSQNGIYIFNDDIFVLKFKTSQFRRITDNKAEEKSIKFSPDGLKVSYVKENNIYVYDIKNEKEVQLTYDGTETVLNGTLSWVYWEEIFGRHNIAYWWADDSKAIAYLQSDESMVSVMHYVDFEPWVPELITQRYPKAGGKNPQVRAGIVDLKTANTTWVKIDTSAYEYLVRVTWMPHSKSLAVQTLNRAQTELDLYFVQRESGEAKMIMQERSEAWVNINDDLHFLENRDQFLWVSERCGYAHIYLFDMAGKMIREITKGDWALLSAGGGVSWLRQAIVALDEKDEWIYFTALKKSSIERQLYRIHLDGSGMERLSQGAGTHSVIFNDNSGYYVDRYSGSKALPSKCLYQNDGKKIAVIAAADSEALAQYEFQTPEYFTINTADTFPLPAMILKPKNFDHEKKYPIILNVYGGPSSPTVVDRYQGVSFDQVLLDNGYIVFKVDPRSAASISKKLENLILYNAWGDLEVNDLSDAVRWLKRQSYVDSNRVGIWGWSGGGTFTLTALTKTTAFKAGIAVAPVSDWHYYDTFYAEFSMKRPQDNPQGYINTSRVNSAKDLHGRLLLVHGTYDDNVNPQNSWAFANELIKNNIMFDMMIYPMRKHGISDKAARIHLFNTMLEFWNKNLRN
jgi:dipeptidyl-peptidase-4